MPDDCVSFAPAEAALGRLRVILAAIDDRAAACDRDGVFPHQDMDALGRAGLLAAFTHPRATSLQLMEALRLIGSVNLSLGRIFEGHVNGIKLVQWYGTDRQRDRMRYDLEAGHIYGVWNTEPAGLGVTARKTEGSIELQGLKSFATGAGAIGRAIITAEFPDGARRMLAVDVSDVARADTSGWRVRGMRATVSGTYDFSGLVLDGDALVGQPADYESEPRFMGGGWRFTAVQLGAVERLVLLLREHMVRGPGQANPVHRARFGQAVAAARTAYLWVRQAAVSADSDDPAESIVALVLLTRRVVEDAALQVMEIVNRTMGTGSFLTASPADRICRDLGLYLRQPAPDEALDRAALAFLARDHWPDDPQW